MLDYIYKTDIWRQLDAGLHSELGWSDVQVGLKTWQDMAVYERLRDATGLQIAEIGGGNSRVLPQLAKTNTCYNIDKFTGQHGGPNSEVVLDGVTNVRTYIGEYHPELTDNGFDVVFSVSVVEHVSHKATAAFMDDLLRTLKPGGVCYHAMAIYVGEAADPGAQRRLETYIGWLERPDVEPLGDVSARQAVFHPAMGSNPDLTMWQWGRVNPSLNEMRATMQSVSLLMGFRKAGQPGIAASFGAAQEPVAAAAPPAQAETHAPADMSQNAAAPQPSASPSGPPIKPNLAQHRISSFAMVLDALNLADINIGHTVDGGGGSGNTAKQILARTRPDTRCYVFEPFPGNHRFFEASNPRLVLRKEAMAEMAKTSHFRVSSTVSEDSEWGQRGMAGYSSVGKLVDTAPDTMTSIEVPCVAADDVIPPEDEVGFVKLDLQGGELGALQGMPRILATAKVMWVEYSNQPGLLAFLHDNGFTVYDTEYFFQGALTPAARAEFYISKEDYTLSTGKTAWFGFKKTPWVDFVTEFDRMKKDYDLTQTDLVCVKTAFVPEFEAAIMAYCGDSV